MSICKNNERYEMKKEKKEWIIRIREKAVCGDS